jgi:3-methyladenine DNA glycosylase Tag
MPSEGKREKKLVVTDLPEDATPFERFEILTKRLLTMPKEAVDKAMAEEKITRKRGKVKAK